MVIPRAPPPPSRRAILTSHPAEPSRRLLSAAAPSMPPRYQINTNGRPIILVGLMGCGKSTVGKELSRQTGMPLLDTDAVIEEQIGKSIPDIFAEYGEAHFRALETALLRYLDTQHDETRVPPIISTGGGTVIRDENRRLLRHIGFVVWLNVDVRILLQRTAGSNHRPLLQNADPEGTLRRLFNERRAAYAAASHLSLDCSHTNVFATARRICKAANRYFAALRRSHR